MRALFAGAVDNCRMRLAAGAVKAASRAQRGRSNAKRLERADANLTIEIDGHTDRQVDLAGICSASSGPITVGKASHRRTGFQSHRSSVI